MGNNPLLQEKARCDASSVSVAPLRCINYDFLAGFRFQLSIEIEVGGKKKLHRDVSAKWQKPVPKAFAPKIIVYYTRKTSIVYIYIYNDNAFSVELKTSIPKIFGVMVHCVWELIARTRFHQIFGNLILLASVKISEYFFLLYWNR